MDQPGTGEPRSNSTLNATTGHERAIVTIRDAILRGELSPGQSLIEAELASQYRFSRGSVRSALIELTGEGLVERIQFRGARVRRADRDTALRITEVRAVNEGLLAAKAARNASHEELTRIVSFREAMLASTGAGDYARYSRLNAALHAAITEAAHHPEALNIVRRLRGLSGVTHQFHLATFPGRAEVSVIEHCSIVNAIEARDPEAAEQAMRAHLFAVVEALSRAAAEANHPLMD